MLLQQKVMLRITLCYITISNFKETFQAMCVFFRPSAKNVDLKGTCHQNPSTDTINLQAKSVCCDAVLNVLTLFVQDSLLLISFTLFSSVIGFLTISVGKHTTCMSVVKIPKVSVTFGH